VSQRRDADRQRNRAVSRQLALQSEKLRQTDPELGLRLALWAMDTSATDEAAEALREATLMFVPYTAVQADSADANAAASSPDGKRVLTGGSDGIALVWDLASRRPVARLRGRAALLAARYSPGGERIALGFADGSVIATDGSLADPRVLLRATGQQVNGLAFSGDGRRIAVALGDGTVRLLAGGSTGRRPERIAGHDGAVLGVDISRDGSRVVSAGEDGAVRLWNSDDGTPMATLRRGGPPERDVAFSPDGSRILGVGDDRRFTVWNARTGAIERSVTVQGRELLSAAFSADSRRFATAGKDGVVQIWSAGGGPPVAVLRGQQARIADVGFGPTSDQLVSAGDDGTVRVWHAGRSEAWTVPSLTYDIDFSRDGRSLASGSDDGTVRIWDPATGREKASLPGPNGLTLNTFSPVADSVVIANSSRARLWPVAAKSASVAVQLPAGRSVESVDFDGTGNRIVYVDDLGKVAVRDLRSGREVVLRGSPGAVLGAVFSPDGRYVAAAPERDVLVWRIDRPDRPQSVLKGHRGAVNALDFSSDDRIVSAGSDRTVRIWNTRGKQLAVMRGHQDELSTALFTPDGAQVLSASQDGSLRLFDARTGATLAVLQSAQGELYDVALSRDGSIATLGKGEVVRVFPCDVCGSLEQVRRLALSRSPRPLTEEERQQFLTAAG
jgi:WD40 repeat protein